MKNSRIRKRKKEKNILKEILKKMLKRLPKKELKKTKIVIVRKGVTVMMRRVKRKTKMSLSLM
jgi:hypothetical protein